MAKKYLTEDDIHAIINQMEVFMSMSAGELADVIVEKRVRAEKRAYDSLKQKVIDATTRMIADMEYGTTLEIEDEDQMAVIPVTENLRDLGYKFRFIEVQDPKGDILSYKLHISVAHLK
jgi:hypothetical protein